MERKAEQGAPAARTAIVNPEAARILEALGACEDKIAEYGGKEGDLRALWNAADEWDKIDAADLLFSETKTHKQHCPVCGGTLPTWEIVHGRLIALGLVPDDRCLIFAPVYSKSGASNG